MAQLPQWWLHDSLPSRLLAPLGALAGGLARLRRLGYQRGWRASERLPVPVVVVGNIFVGGTGKTPLVVWLARHLAERGHRPGVLVRGYGGRSPEWPRRVGPDSDPAEVGDEAVLLARRCGCPVMAGPDRIAAGRALLGECDLLISDDGLQHYRLQRDLELVVVDASRGLGNGRCLPAGPLREPPGRLASVDMVIANGQPGPLSPYSFTLMGDTCVRISDGERRPLSAFRGEPVHAVAGIGNPARFFDSLRRAGLEPREHAFADHHPFRAEDLRFGDQAPVIMTEKDAVKVGAWAEPHHWYLTVDAVPTAATVAALEQRLESLLQGRRS